VDEIGFDLESAGVKGPRDLSWETLDFVICAAGEKRVPARSLPYWATGASHFFEFGRWRREMNREEGSRLRRSVRFSCQL